MSDNAQDQKPGRRGQPSQPAEAKTPNFRAAHGLMVHPFTGARFDQSNEVAHEEDSWVGLQVEAGKLLKV